MSGAQPCAAVSQFITNMVATATSPAQPPTFHASHEDIRVNILWFTSLVLSLMTASFGMLVKQWLREYLAAELPSPQARLRIRHFRAPQMTRWVVYEIVACLPLLLQLSLGLFFTGLCYFTASVHADVGHAILPLVVGWALCFFSATVLPLFFPMCPYRTTFLISLAAHLHRCISWAATQIISRFLTKQDQLQSAESGLNSTTQDRDMEMQTKSDFRGANWLWGRFSHWFDVLTKIPDERVIAKDPRLDVEILVSVDAIHANDELLESTIISSLDYIRPTPQDAVWFALQTLSHRVQTEATQQLAETYWPFHHSFSLDSLSSQARTAILKILHQHVGALELSTPLLDQVPTACNTLLPRTRTVFFPSLVRETRPL